MADSPWRQEARYLDWEDLTEEQRVVVDQAYEMLMAVAPPTPDAKSENGAHRRTLPRLTPRTNQFLLIDGKRGTGKTTVLLTLIELLNSGRDPRAPEKRSPRAGSMWALPPLDLREIPPGMPLLLWVAVHLYSVVEGHKQGQASMPAWAVEENGDLDGAWHRLVHAATAASSLKQRAAKTDPETHAVELEEAARDKQTVLDCFKTFVNVLSKHCHARHSGPNSSAGEAEKHVFVISIDDADMNPTRALELLELGSHFHHPQMVFMATGDEGLFLSVLENHYLRVLDATKDSPRMQARARDARRLTRDVLAKLIPVPQRLKVHRVPRNRRLQHLGDKLDRLHLLWFGKAKSLKALFEVEPELAEALPARLRALEALRGQLAQMPDTAPGAPSEARYADGILAQLWQEALAELEGGMADDITDSPIELRDGELWVDADRFSGGTPPALLPTGATVPLGTEGAADFRLLPSETVPELLPIDGRTGDELRAPERRSRSLSAVALLALQSRRAPVPQAQQYVVATVLRYLGVKCLWGGLRRVT